ncbi:MAG TPA: translational GTPase TypA [Acetomicrobium flavidum]|uniref:Large ribosomal subunit assembly factor BipA n=1 Tax=Acetomicrobium mobile (strain ATCC BAA-54 / DSM 13181 / JCM 12221 / NGA) TaxID=891968 RepID=I4BYA5_ACEMN|nr:translational GTPase TypA [Acetomicrobium mobile]HOJ82037.1 translational GTPase TypA [Acetomicrobium flavidum]AFM22262.1 GTP-binding protein TypA/BipA [Acetomicrobium mobile DSM 13181]HOM30977.1 translational GTPase TypA [Acetomicrobium flavidum]HOP87935.1 translational GTPase TypA [Acetomicrobium flavidum]HPP13761.1 translational GTPase TypA [Acetomicrobium flavidum]
MNDISKIRNVAIVAHIDHGKTTLLDSVFRATRLFRENAKVEERIMDSDELERERGITIRSKHCSVQWNGYLINIIDTPGHADFSGEVERILYMVDSVLLLVDANEGPMPQTRYVLMRALKAGLKPIVVLNKVDRPNANVQEALNATFDLFLELGATDEQADFPVLYGSGLDGWFVKDLEHDKREGMDALFETIISYVPAPVGDIRKPFLMQATTLTWNNYIGRVGCGRILQGKIKKGDLIVRTSTAWLDRNKGEWNVTGQEIAKVSHLWMMQGLKPVEVDEASAGDVVWISGPEDILIGDTLSAEENSDVALAPLDIEEPTVSMFFLVNNGPFAGKEGKPVTLRQIKDRLIQEARVNVALKVEDIGRPDGLKVSGRGELHLAILIEEMRREGMEFCVSRPEVITKYDEEHNLLEPIEQLIIDIPEEYQGVVIEKISRRKGEFVSVQNLGTGLLRLEFNIPTRGLIGYRTEFLTDTRGLGIMSSRFIGYDLWRGEITGRNRGSMVSMDTGEATSYQLDSLQHRGTLFISPMDEVYEGMVIGEHSRPNDLPCNPTKKKHVTNHRSASKDTPIILDVPRKLTLDAALEWIAEDELVEVTPLSVRVRKSILRQDERKKAAKKVLANC